jgi:hypothetical protein
MAPNSWLVGNSLAIQSPKFFLEAWVFAFVVDDEGFFGENYSSLKK